MPDRDYLEELEFLRIRTMLHEDSSRSLAAYLHSLAEAVERGLGPDKRLAAAEAALEAALGLLSVYRTAHPDSCLEQMSNRIGELVCSWRSEQDRVLVR